MTDTPMDKKEKDENLEKLREFRDIIKQTRDIADRVLDLVESFLKNLED